MNLTATKRVGMAILLASSAAAWGGATVSIQNAPATLQQGQPAAVTCSFAKTADETEKRVIVRLDLHDADNGIKVAGTILDNSGAGYTGTTGNVSGTVQVPSNASGAYYFTATVSPWSMNKAIVAHMKTYPTDGTFTYKWESGYGVTQDVPYKGVIVAQSDRDNTCYCSGLSFQCFVLPFNAYNAQYGHSQIGNIGTSSQMGTFRKVWYGVTDAEKLAARAIPEWGAGREITDWEEAQEGDYVQLWRWSGSGHNPIFVNWIRTNGQITGVRYWGTQGSTNGIGYNTESFGTSTKMNPARFYLGRAAKPRDQADYDWALGSATTADRPSQVGSGVGDWAAYAD